MQHKNSLIQITERQNHCAVAAFLRVPACRLGWGQSSRLRPLIGNPMVHYRFFPFQHRNDLKIFKTPCDCVEQTPIVNFLLSHSWKSKSTPALSTQRPQWVASFWTALAVQRILEFNQWWPRTGYLTCPMRAAWMQKKWWFLLRKLNNHHNPKSSDTQMDGTLTHLHLRTSKISMCSSNSQDVSWSTSLFCRNFPTCTCTPTSGLLV